MHESPTPDRKATVLLLLAIAGCIDAVGLAETGQFFVSFMSGNTTSLGQALAYGNYRPALLPLGLVALFVGGATLGALVAEKARDFAAAAVLALVAVLIALAWAGVGSLRPALGIMLLPVAMGAANIVTWRGGATGASTTYATGSLVSLGIGLAGLGRDVRARDIGFDLARWLCLLAGSVAGAALRVRYGDAVLAGLALILALLALFHLAMAARRR